MMELTRTAASAKKVTLATRVKQVGICDADTKRVILIYSLNKYNLFLTFPLDCCQLCSPNVAHRITLAEA